MAANPLDLPQGLSIAEAELWLTQKFYSVSQIVGVDEAGRGPLAGPVVAAACILPNNSTLIKNLRDSKKLSEKKREELFEPIKSEAIAYGIGWSSPTEIDEVNILQATFLSMQRAIDCVNPSNDLIALIDGNQILKSLKIKQFTVVKGDDRIACIAAASILAKVSRDRYMYEIDQVYPQYHWSKNKGYGSIDHRLAMKEYGLTKHHRKTFKWKIPEFKA